MTELALSRIADAQRPAIDALILRSKAYWGYGPDIMARMQAALRLDRNAARTGRATAAWRRGAPAGVAQISEPKRGAPESPSSLTCFL